MSSSMILSGKVVQKVAKELHNLEQKPMEGISVSYDEDDVTEVYATIEGPMDTPFEGGQFKMKLTLGTDFPSAPPKGYFLTKIFHPNVSLQGEICINTLKKDWKPELGLSHIFLTVKCLLINPNPESALNEEAGRLFMEDYDEYSQVAKLWTSVHAQKGSDDNTSKENETDNQGNESSSSSSSNSSNSSSSVSTKSIVVKKNKSKKDKKDKKKKSGAAKRL